MYLTIPNTVSKEEEIVFSFVGYVVSSAYIIHIDIATLAFTPTPAM